MQVGEGHLDLTTDLAAAEHDGLVLCGCMVNGGMELLFHADRRTAAVDIACERQQLLALDHGDALLPYRLCRLFQIQLAVDRYHEHIMLFACALCDEGLEHSAEFLPERFDDFHTADRACGGVIMALVGQLMLFYDAHDVCFFCFLLFHIITIGIVSHICGFGKR